MPPGFQGSETTSAEVVIYRHSGDPILTLSGAMKPDGRKAIDPNACLVSATTSKTMGAPSGNFTITLKPSQVSDEIFESVKDDDWVDITFTRHARKWHTMRGIVDEVRRNRAVGGSGATSKGYTITGRDFGKVWERTNIWFNPMTGEDIAGSMSAKVFTGVAEVLGSPTIAVEGFLEGFLKELANVGRNTWDTPTSMPNTTDDNFAQSFVYFDDAFTNFPARTAINKNFMTPTGNLWSLAKEWSDPLFTELFVDLLPADTKYPEQNRVLGVDETAMVVTFRDKPFPLLATAYVPDGLHSPWFTLPLFTIPRQMVTNDNIGRSGHERYNAFFVAPQLTQELLESNAIDVVQPLWDESDIRRHGLQRFDVTTRYTSEKADIPAMTSAQREAIRDWYAINPYLLSGTVELGEGMPDIHIGVRARFPGETGPEQDETYYVEQVSHSWRFGPGLKTTLGLTRGWIGTDNSLLDAMREINLGYSIPGQAVPTEA